MAEIVFFSYAHEDHELMDSVRRQLVMYEREGMIVKWYDRLILPGQEWEREIDERINRASIILLLVSPYFLDSRYCYNLEMRTALRRHESGSANVIPIIVSPCPWEDSPFGFLKVLPEGGRPIALWPNRDEACLNVARGVMRVVRERNRQPATLNNGTLPTTGK